MRHLSYSFFLVFLLVSCNNTPPEIPSGFVEKTLYLCEDYDWKKVGLVSIAIPEQLDTLLIWEDHFDDASTIIRHRFVNKRGCLKQETGFFKDEFCEDSTIRLTINGYKITRYKDMKTFMEEYVWKDSVIFRDIKASLSWKKRSLETRGNVDYAILHSVRDEATFGKLEKLDVFVIKKGILYEFCWDCAGIDCRDFFKKAYKSIPTIQIDTICKQ